MDRTTKIEAILFVASKPLTYKKLAKSLACSEAEAIEAIEVLKGRYNHEDSGIFLVESDGSVQLVTNPDASEYVEQFTKSEVMGELTRAQLETLTVVAYQQPITRPEIEQIRGVNCAVILRNLMLRGLVQEKDSKEAIMPTYSLTVDALRHLGVQSVQELPEYDTLHKHEYLVAQTE